MAKKTDPRVIRTRRMLREALIALIVEKGYDAINILDIAERAGLRRATFYLHYHDKEALLLSMMRETLDELMQKMETLPDNSFGAEAQFAEHLMIFQHVQERANLYRAILSGRGAAQVTRDIRDYLAARIREECLTDHPGASLPVPVEVLANYLAAVKLNMIIWWLEKGMPYPPEEMAAMCARLMLNGVGEIMASVA